MHCSSQIPLLFSILIKIRANDFTLEPPLLKVFCNFLPKNWTWNCFHKYCPDFHFCLNSRGRDTCRKCNFIKTHWNPLWSVLTTYLKAWTWHAKCPKGTRAHKCGKMSMKSYSLKGFAFWVCLHFITWVRNIWGRGSKKDVLGEAGKLG